MDAAIRNKIRKALVARRADQFRFLAQTVRTRSEIPPGDLVPHAQKTMERLKDVAGLIAVRHRVPDEEAAAHGLVGLANLVVRHEFGPGPTIALQAHADTVPAGQGWGGDPFAAEIQDGVMYGRGVAEAKGSLAAYVFALVALRDIAVPISGTVELHVTYDHETGGALGVPWLLECGVINPDYAICPGGTWSVVTRHHGALRLTVEVRGQGTAAGADAAQATARVLDALYALRAAYAARPTQGGMAPPVLSVGGIHGGEGGGIAPGSVTIGVSRTLLPDEDPGKVEQDLALHLGKAVAGLAGVVCRIRRLELVPPLKPAPGTEPLVEALREGARNAFDFSIRETARAEVSDARHYAAVGIPAVLYGAGPRNAAEANIGGADENIALDDLRRATEAVACALAIFLQAGR